MIPAPYCATAECAASAPKTQRTAGASTLPGLEGASGSRLGDCPGTRLGSGAQGEKRRQPRTGRGRRRRDRPGEWMPTDAGSTEEDGVITAR
jgi:hypothetical protein